MFRRLGLTLVLLAAASNAAERDVSRQVQEAADRPVFPPAPFDSETTRKVKQLQEQLLSVDARLAKMESLLQNQTALDLLKEVEAMKAEISRLRGLVEMQTHQMDSLGKRQTDLYSDLDKRLEDMHKQVKAAALPPPQPPPPVATPVISPPLALVPSTQVSTAPSASIAAAPAQSADSKPAEDPLVESKAYESALSQFKAASYAAAIAGFRSFIKAYPDSGLAANAQYWIGYSYYALKDYKSAVAQQQKLLSAYPKSAKVPDALLTIANSQTELNEIESARKSLEEIVTKHPGTNAAKLAARRLATLK
jgi:tol-pal system protein YbgF